MKNDIEKNLDALKIEKEKNMNSDATKDIEKLKEEENKKVEEEKNLKENKKVEEEKNLEENKKVEKEEEAFNFSNYAKLYRFDKEKNKFFERGEGTAKIELVEEKKLYRILLIRSKINTLACNHYIEPNAHFKQHSMKNAFIWQTTTDRVEEKITLQSQYSNRSTVNEKEQIYLLRFRKIDAEAAELFEKQFTGALSYNKEQLEKESKN